MASMLNNTYLVVFLWFFRCANFESHNGPLLLLRVPEVGGRVAQGVYLYLHFLGGHYYMEIDCQNTVSTFCSNVLQSCRDNPNPYVTHLLLGDPKSSVNVMLATNMNATEIGCTALHSKAESIR